jgi:hypothetical protein
MKILADESVEKGVVQRLRRDGHDVNYVAELSPGIMDETISLTIPEHGAELLKSFSVITEKAVRIRSV